MWDILDNISEGKDFENEIVSIPVVRSAVELITAIRAMRASPAADLVHAQFGSLVGALTSFKSVSTRVTSLRGSDLYWRYGTKRNAATGFIRICMSWVACLRSDAVIVMSQAMRSRLAGMPFLNRKAIYVIPDPAAKMFWLSELRDIKLAIMREPFRILIASVLSDNPVKRLSIITDAIALCQNAGLNISLEQLSGKTREEVLHILESVDSVALSSTHEGWPNIIKEALLAGRQFVSTDVSDMKSFVFLDSGNKILQSHPIDFAFAWIDQIAENIIKQYNVELRLAIFHPDVVGIKHNILYSFYKNMPSR